MKEGENGGKCQKCDFLRTSKVGRDVNANLRMSVSTLVQMTLL